jgi:hypothetical protein
MTLGNAAAARVWLIVWRKGCQRQIEPDPAEMAARYGARRPHRVTDLAGGRCRIAPGIRVTNADRTAL